MAEKNNSQEIKSDDLPQEITESYGTGVKDISGYNVTASQDEYTETSPQLTGGDVDAYWQDADAVGDEAVGGTVSTPDQNVTDDIGAAVGLEMNDNELIHTKEILDKRDDVRWELSPSSSEDYEERNPTSPIP